MIEEPTGASEEYLRTGKVVVPVADEEALRWITGRVADIVRQESGSTEKDDQLLLNGIHRVVDGDRLNEFRVSVIQSLNADPEFRRRYLAVARPTLEELVGNELVMQKRVNLSIQMPKDASSLLAVHADTWSGDSPFEIVVWLPLVDCHGTKSMYFLPGDAEASTSIGQRLFDGGARSSDDVYRMIAPEVEWLTVKWGEVLLFDQSLPHGNVVNETSETRWSMNCRFKSPFSPYGDKKLGEFFEPITMRPCSLRGMRYRLPEIR